MGKRYGSSGKTAPTNLPFPARWGFCCFLRAKVRHRRWQAQEEANGSRYSVTVEGMQQVYCDGRGYADTVTVEGRVLMTTSP